MAANQYGKSYNVKQNTAPWNRQHAKVVLHNLPQYTTVSEVNEMLQAWVPGINIVDISVLIPEKKKIANIKTLIAFVQLDTNKSADDIVAHYYQHKNALGTDGYMYTNKTGVTSELSVTYCYQKPYKTNEKHASDSNSLKVIQVENQFVLSSVKSLEDKLKKIVPDLFVSELEMNELREEEDNLNRTIQDKMEQLEIVKLELKELKEVKELYDELSDGE